MEDAGYPFLGFVLAVFDTFGGWAVFGIIARHLVS
jgi:hypothetical protein